MFQTLTSVKDETENNSSFQQNSTLEHKLDFSQTPRLREGRRPRRKPDRNNLLSVFIRQIQQHKGR